MVTQEEFKREMTRMLNEHQLLGENYYLQVQSCIVIFNFLVDTQMIWKDEVRFPRIVQEKLCELAPRWPQADVFAKLLFPNCDNTHAAHAQHEHDQA